jgi:hypothetical protein
MHFERLKISGDILKRLRALRSLEFWAQKWFYMNEGK